MKTAIRLPQSAEHDPYYKMYFDLLGDEKLFTSLDAQIRRLRESLANVSAEESETLHAPYTWSIKQAIGHCIDNERVFGYRALRFASGDTTDLPGYDQDIYVARYNYKKPTLAELVDEFEVVRRSNLLLLKRLPEKSWDMTGSCDNRSISVRSIAWLLVAHLRHHLNIVRKRIGKD